MNGGATHENGSISSSPKPSWKRYEPEIKKMASRRLDLVAGLPVLSIQDDVRTLVRIYNADLGLPPQAGANVLHIAFAVAYELDSGNLEL